MTRATRCGRLAGAGLALALLALGAVPARALQTEDLHTVSVRIHTNLIDAGMGMDLAFWQERVDEAMAQATAALQGFQGPNDVPCCTRIEPTAALSEFGSPVDGLDVIMFDSQFDSIRNQFGDGVYVVLSLEVCGTTQSPSVVGCADTPGNFLVLDVDALDVLGLTLAHERGHNGGLLHPNDRIPFEEEDPCDLMAASNGGGCLDTAECAAYASKADTTGLACRCLGSAPGDPPLPNGTACTPPLDGLCSGGLCGDAMDLAGVRILGTGGSAELPTADLRTLLELSSLTGGYSSRGVAADEITGLAYDPSRDVLFGVRLDRGPIAGADDLVTIDRTTGAITEIVGSLGLEDPISLAYDPTADVLYMIQLGSEIFGGPAGCSDCVSTLYSVDPTDGNATELGVLNGLILAGGVDGLAYDSGTGTLFGSTGAGLFTIATACTGGGFPTCATVQVDNLFVQPSSLAFDPATGALFRAGLRFAMNGSFEALDAGTGNPADPETGERLSFMGVRNYAPGGLAALPVPEPGALAASLAGLGAVAALALRRRRGA